MQPRDFIPRHIATHRLEELLPSAAGERVLGLDITGLQVEKYLMFVQNVSILVEFGMSSVPLNWRSTGIEQKIRGVRDASIRTMASFSARSWPCCLSSVHGPVPNTRSNRQLVRTKHAWSVISRYFVDLLQNFGR